MTPLLLVMAFGLAPQEKGPTPDGRALAEAEKTVQALFKNDYAKRLPRERAALAAKLLEQARQTKDDPAGQYVLYREAADNFARGGALEACFDAIDAWGRFYEIDRADLMAKALATASRLARTPEEAVAYAAAQLRAAEVAAEADRFDLAEKQVQAAVAGAKKAANVPLFNRATAKEKEIRERKAAFEKVKSALAILEKSPEDADANAVAGRYRCFVKGAWRDGLPMLAKGSDGPLRSLAEQDLAGPGTSAEQAALAEGWWAVGESLGEPSKTLVRQHAVEWLERALPTLGGAAKATAEKRVSEHHLAKLFRGDWMDVDLRQLVGATGVGEPPPSGFYYRVLNPMPSGHFDAVSIRIRATGKEPGNIVVAVENRPTQSVYFDQVQRILYTTRKEGPAVRRDAVVKLAPREEHRLAVVLEGAELVVFLDGREQIRVPSELREIAYLRLERLTGSGTFDEVRLRRKP